MAVETPRTGINGNCITSKVQVYRLLCSTCGKINIKDDETLQIELNSNFLYYGPTYLIIMM